MIARLGGRSDSFTHLLGGSCRKREIMPIEREVPAAFVRSTNAVDSRSMDQSRESGHEPDAPSRVGRVARNHRSTCGLFF